MRDESTSIQLLLVDDHKMVLEGLRNLIKQQPNLAVIGEAATGREAVRKVSELNPDVVIMDLTIPDLNGIEATRQILSNNPNVRVIALSMHSDQVFVTEMLKAGAKGYLCKDDDFDDLLSAIRAVMVGRTFLSPQIADWVVRDYIQFLPSHDSPQLMKLSPREGEVLRLLAEGKAIKEIAAELGISGKTVHSHRQKVMQKLNLSNMTDLIRFSIQEGIIPANP
jgi:DNA-binding NarL/FixJ family response regulator